MLKRNFVCLLAFLIVLSNLSIASAETLPADDEIMVSAYESSETDIQDTIMDQETFLDTSTMTDDQPVDVVADFKDAPGVMKISDEDFYGQYDTETQTWVKASYFDYDKFPEMAAVKQAVMEVEDGDYSLVKEEILQYYRQKTQTYRLPKYGTVNSESINLAKALEKNLWYHPTWKWTGTAKVDGEARYHSIDVTEFWGSMKSNADIKVSFYLMAYEKDGNMAEFSSREGDNPPVLEIESNGAITKLTAVEDATIIAGTNATKNYGSEKTLRVEESVTTRGKAQPTDSNTKRAHIKFDLSQFNINNTVDRVTLKIYGKNATNAEQKEVIAFFVPINGWVESSVTFRDTDGTNAYEHMAYSWDGDPYVTYMAPDFMGFRYREEFERFETWMPKLIGLYTQATENNEEYAYLMLRQWVGWLYQQGNEPRGSKGQNQIKLDAGCRAATFPEGFANLISSEHMTPDIYSATLKCLWLYSDLIRGGWCIDEYNNFGLIGANALIALNAYYPEFRIYDAVLEKIRSKMKMISETALIDDEGAYDEAAMAYAGMAAVTYYKFTMPNSVTGITDSPFYSKEDEDIQRKIVLSTIDYAMPGLRDPQWGDSAEYTSTFDVRVDEAANVYDDPVIQYFATDGVEGSYPDHTSIMYDHTKRVIMRTGWDDQNMYLFTDVDGYDSSHAHADDNAIILWAYGNYLLADPWLYSYTWDDLRIYFHSSQAHNTVDIDGISQKGNKNEGGAERGLIEHWETNDVYDNASTTTYGYRDQTPKNTLNEKYTRNILFLRDDFYIVNDYLKPFDTDTKAHMYRQNWHMIPSANISVDTDTLTSRTNFASQANIQIVQGEKGGLAAEKKNAPYVKTTADYVEYQKTSAGPTTFNTVLFPEKVGESVEVSAEEIVMDDVADNGASAMEITIDNSSTGRYSDIFYYIVNDPAQKRARAFGRYETDARLAYVERNKAGELKKIILQDGTYIKDLVTDRIIYQSLEEVSHIAIEFIYGDISVSSSQNISLEKSTIYADVKTSTRNVLLNNEAQDFEQNGRYLYFSSEPILEDPDGEEPPDSGSSKPQTPSGGGGGSINQGGSGSISPIVPPMVTTGTSSGNQTGNVSGNTSSEQQSPFAEEIENYWGKAEIQSMVDKGYLNGIDGKLELDSNLTRAQAVTLLVRVLGLDGEALPENRFQDISSDDWFYEAVLTAASAGLIDGDADGYFHAESFITREELAKIMVNAYEKQYGVKDVGTDQPFTDMQAASQWAQPYIQKAFAYGLMQGDGTLFFPKDFATRGESAVVIYRAFIQQQEDEK